VRWEKRVPKTAIANRTPPAHPPIASKNTKPAPRLHPPPRAWKKLNWPATLFPVRIHMLGVRGKKILKKRWNMKFEPKTS
jgi:hypothetical protein